MDHSQWIDLIKTAFNYGVPTGLAVLLLFGIGFATYRAGAFFGGMIRDMVDQVVKPAAEAHIAYFKESTETMAHIRKSVDVSGDRHNRTHAALGHVVEAVHASTPEERQPKVRPHLDAVKETLR